MHRRLVTIGNRASMIVAMAQLGLLVRHGPAPIRHEPSMADAAREQAHSERQENRTSDTYTREASTGRAATRRRAQAAARLRKAGAHG